MAYNKLDGYFDFVSKCLIFIREIIFISAFFKR